MISIKRAKLYCGEDISLIENYEEAVNDKEKTWHCHHRKEDDGFLRDELKQMGLYYKRTAKELIFMTESDHRSLHRKDNKLSEETKSKISKAHKGKTHSEETKRKISNSCKGKTLSEEHKRKISDAHKGKYMGNKSQSARKVYQIDKNTGEIIKEWSCMKLAAKIFSLTPTAIYKCCIGKSKTSGGYVWRYADNKKEQD